MLYTWVILDLGLSTVLKIIYISSVEKVINQCHAWYRHLSSFFFFFKVKFYAQDVQSLTFEDTDHYRLETQFAQLNQDETLQSAQIRNFRYQWLTQHENILQLEVTWFLTVMKQSISYHYCRPIKAIIHSRVNDCSTNTAEHSCQNIIGFLRHSPRKEELETFL